MKDEAKRDIFANAVKRGEDVFIVCPACGRGLAFNAKARETAHELPTCRAYDRLIAGAREQGLRLQNEDGSLGPLMPVDKVGLS